MFSLPPQVFINGLIAGSMYALVALGLALTYGILKFINFAHVEMATIGVYIFYGLQLAGLDITTSFIAAALLTGIAGIIIEKLTFKPIKNRNSYAPMLASIGLGLLIQALIALIAGGNVKTLERSFIKSYSFMNDTLFITNLQIGIIVTSAILMTGLFIFLKYAKLGKAIRAVSDNAEAAAIVGINNEKIIAIIFFIASMLAAVGGILIGYQNNLLPVMGVALIVKAFTAVIVGGMGNIPGAIAGAYLIGILENMSIGLTIGGFSIPAGYKDGIAFMLLIITLLFRPNGLFHKSKQSSIC